MHMHMHTHARSLSHTHTLLFSHANTHIHTHTVLSEKSLWARLSQGQMDRSMKRGITAMTVVRETFWVQPIPSSVTFSKSSFKAQSWKVFFLLNCGKSDVWALSFETAFENVVRSGIGCTCWIKVPESKVGDLLVMGGITKSIRYCQSLIVEITPGRLSGVVQLLILKSSSVFPRKIPTYTYRQNNVPVCPPLPPLSLLLATHFSYGFFIVSWYAKACTGANVYVHIYKDTYIHTNKRLSFICILHCQVSL